MTFIVHYDGLFQLKDTPIEKLILAKTIVVSNFMPAKMPS